MHMKMSPFSTRHRLEIYLHRRQISLEFGAIFRTPISANSLSPAR